VVRDPVNVAKTRIDIFEVLFNPGMEEIYAWLVLVASQTAVYVVPETVVDM
jgi:hypothetical protein